MAEEIVAGVAITALTLDVIKGVLGEIEAAARKIAMGVFNGTDSKWKKGSVYFGSGASDVIIPYKVDVRKCFTYGARKTLGPVATGAVGVIAYNMDDGDTLAIMFSVPFDYNLYNNCWNVKIYNGHQEANSTMFNEMYNKQSYFVGNDTWESKKLNDKYMVEGIMTSSSESILQIYVVKELDTPPAT
ncbi:DELTA-sagatoxin-Srs1a-like [Dysidea avara]|uniref:DELTA-sagatoxin-Srs1a-like n=1 Tax=Dysidea avara TaxID=196820 RepID=UPI00332C5644